MAGLPFSGHSEKGLTLMMDELAEGSSMLFCSVVGVILCRNEEQLYVDNFRIRCQRSGLIVWASTN